ncbi:MAG TPA: dialkylresorcinol condensing enzyme, partial [Planctomycetota bacterium]|nr:dialkylresorcinol condensing enzyme [Planctomycetota bacterium]
MKRVLVVQYSQSGQLCDVLSSLTAPLAADPSIELTIETLRPVTPYPFPWPVLRFFDTFPEAIYLDPPPLQELAVDPARRFDVVILGYQAWFLSPSLPVTAFLKSPEASRLLRDTPVVTVVACRDMWLMAQERVKELLAAVGARLVGHVALTDEAGSIG